MMCVFLAALLGGICGGLVVAASIAYGLSEGLR